MSNDSIRKCRARRCEDGTVYLASGQPVVCASCGGTGTISSINDTRKYNEAKQTRLSAMHILQDRVKEITGKRNSTMWDDAHWAIELLEKNEPNRALKLWESVHANRIDDCLNALLAYLKENA